MIVPESVDLSWSPNSTSLQKGEIRSSMVTKKKDHKSYGYAAKNLTRFVIHSQMNLYFSEVMCDKILNRNLKISKLYL